MEGTPKQTFLNEHIALFMLVQIVKLCHSNFNSINKRRFYRDATRHFISSKGTLILKNNTFHVNSKY